MKLLRDRVGIVVNSGRFLLQNKYYSQYKNSIDNRPLLTSLLLVVLSAVGRGAAECAGALSFDSATVGTEDLGRSVRTPILYKLCCLLSKILLPSASFCSAKRLSLLVARGLLSLEPLGRPRLADTAAMLPRVIVASPEGAADVAVARLAAPERPS